MFESCLPDTHLLIHSQVCVCVLVLVAHKNQHKQQLLWAVNGTRYTLHT